jgi:hypothetical protein
MTDVVTLFRDPNSLSLLLVSGLLPPLCEASLPPGSRILCVLRAPLRACRKVVDNDGVHHLGWYLSRVDAICLQSGYLGFVRVVFPDGRLLDAPLADFSLTHAYVTTQSMITLEDVRVLHPGQTRFR